MDEFAEMQVMVCDLVCQFREAKFASKVSDRMNYDENTHFKESNITVYLAELEEYLSSLIMYGAFKKGDPEAAISAVPLDALNQKTWSAHQIGIEAPHETSRAGDNSTVDEDDVRDIMTDPKQLYMRFMD